ncbi:MAG: hypothetical protein OEZ10_11350 [Gammaproteobacteria bacterium]|nr:hypothetical protein [Gammaproteobacteria bacterium]
MSNQNNHFSNELIHAFIDDQLTIEERAEMYKSINSDQDLNRQVCELRKIRDLVQLSYSDIPPPPGMRNTTPTRKTGWRFPVGSSIAAGIALLVGIAIGGNMPGNESAATSTTLASKQVAANGISQQASQKVLFHLNSGKKEDMKEALDEVEQLLKHYAATGVQAQLEFVTNGEAITLLNKDTSPFVDRVKNMLASYDNIRFVACQNSIDQHTNPTTMAKLRLIPGTVVIDSGVAQIMRRQHQGWAYIRA